MGAPGSHRGHRGHRVSGPGHGAGEAARKNGEGRMQTARIRAWPSGWGTKRGILEPALGEGVIKCITVIHLICRWLGGGYGNTWGREGRRRRMLLAGRALDCGRCARPLRIGDCGLRKPKLGGEQPKLINSEWPIPDFLIS